MKKLSTIVVLLCLTVGLHAQQISKNRAHSHNDYSQNIPLFTAYYANAGSIEADVFFVDGKLIVSHDTAEIAEGRTLDSLYLKPLAHFFYKNHNQPYADPGLDLQLFVDIKADYQRVIPELVKELNAYPGVFNDPANKHVIKVVLSGETPDPSHYADYPEFVRFDGRPGVKYSEADLKRVAQISADISDYTTWTGKGTLTPQDSAKIQNIINAAHAYHKPFRFWATQDNPNTWIQLEKLGVDWLNTDHPQQLQDFLVNRPKLEYINPKPYAVYHPSYKSDGSTRKVKNIILLIGDGMGPAQIQAGQTTNHGRLNMTECHFSGFSQTASANSGTTDSAAGATAMACGEKTNNRYIGVDAQGKPLPSLPDLLSQYGIKNGIISVGDITDATPAAFYAHQLDRESSQLIAHDLLTSHVDILIGSNQKSFMNNADKQLMGKLAAKQYHLVTSLPDLKNVSDGKQLVLLKDSDTRPVKNGRGDMLRQSLNETIRLLSSNKKGFFIMAEGAQIDYGGHANDLPYIVTELHDFDKTVAEALKFADQDGETLVIVTADHETGGLSILDASATQNMVLGAFSTNDHTSVNVPVFAYGPHSQDFIGTYQNTEIFRKILKLMTEGGQKPKAKKKN